MYSDKQNILHLVALLKEHGISQIVLCPGSRNSPLVHTLSNISDFHCHLVIDERSAGFYALGIIQQTGQPVAVCCTSGSAVLNLSPAVAEAFYQQLPLLVLTADRPEAWINQMDGQTIPQRGCYGQLVKKSFQLPELSSEESEWHANRLINEAILGLEHPVPGPVHINIPLSEPLFNYTEPSLPRVRKINRTKPTVEPPHFYKELFTQAKKPLIIIGQMPPCKQLKGIISDLVQQHGCTVLCEHLANLHHAEAIGNFDALLYSLTRQEQENLVPDLLITIGGHIVSKRLKQFLRSHTLDAHWHISADGQIIDLFQQLSDSVQCDPVDFLQMLTTSSPVERQYHHEWSSLASRIRIPDLPFSDIAAAGKLIASLPDNSSLHLANSSSVRLAQLYSIKTNNINVLCNRGTNGIEGSLSSAVGYAAVSKQQTFLLIGDLSFFYDMNGLWNRQLSPNLRIMLNNNGGGEIFHALPGLNQSNALSYIAGTHHASARSWAESMGLTYLAANSAEELEHHMPAFLDQNSKHPVLLEVFTTMEANTCLLRQYYHQLKQQ